MNGLHKWFLRQRLIKGKCLVFNKIEYKSGITKIVFHSYKGTINEKEVLITEDKRTFRYADYGTKRLVLRAKTIYTKNWWEKPKLAKLTPYKAHY